MMRDADIRGMTLMNADDAELQGIHAAIIAGLENGSLRPVIGKEMSLADAAQAHEAVLEAGVLRENRFDPVTSPLNVDRTRRRGRRSYRRT